MADRDNRRLPADDLLAAYELGLLDDDDRARFEAALLDDPDLLDELYDGAVDANLIQADAGRFAAAARAGLPRVAKADQEPWLDRLRQWLQPRALMPAATVAALALAAVMFWPRGQAFDPARLAVIEPLIVVTVNARSGAAAADQHHADALASYVAGDWTAAAAAFEAALAAADGDWPRRDQAQLYQGSSLLLAGDTDLALAPLAAAAGSRLAPVRDRAAWTLTQAHLLRGDHAAAAAILRTLTTSPGLGDRAAELLTQLPDGK